MSGACFGETDTGVPEAASALNPQSTRVSNVKPLLAQPRCFPASGIQNAAVFTEAWWGTRF